MINPLPDNKGVGFFTTQKIDESLYPNWRIERINDLYTNFHATRQAWDCSFMFPPSQYSRIDGFSPNLNKRLHVGHLRNLVLASSLSKILQSEPVAMLGASLGVVSTAKQELDYWFKLAQYNPELYYDVLLPIDILTDIKDRHDDEGTCKIWNGPKGEVIIEKSDGTKTYAHHDLVFAKTVSPNYYITGCEQADHFASLGLKEKHIPMGLVLGEDGKKIKSRNGEMLSAYDALHSVIDELGDIDSDAKKIAWNILSWNFLSTKAHKNIKFNPEEWSNPNHPGLYITYTYARVYSAIESALDANKARLLDHHSSISQSYAAKKMVFHIASVAAPNQVKSIDYELACMATYYPFYLNLAYTHKDPSWLANFAFRLSKKLTQAYHFESIIDGRNTFQTSIDFALTTLNVAMKQLGMYPMKRV